MRRRRRGRDMNSDAIIQHAGWVLFAWVFVNQSGVPVPVVPSLVAAGALAGRGGSSCAVMLAAAAGAALVADMVWYGIGRWHGAQVLSLLGRVLHRPRVWVDHIEHAFHAHEVGFQLWAQFLPQLNPIAAGLAGATGVGLPRYIVIASAAAMAWAGTWIAVVSAPTFSPMPSRTGASGSSCSSRWRSWRSAPSDLRADVVRERAREGSGACARHRWCPLRQRGCDERGQRVERLQGQPGGRHYARHRNPRRRPRTGAGDRQDVR